MDSLTHILLGGAIGQSLFPRRLGRLAFSLGAMAATLPDFDVLIHTGNVVHNHSLHRHFMHSLLIIPLLATAAVVPFLLVKRLRSQWPVMLLVATLACLSHTLLDSLT